jgi:hypothetical protein
MKKRPLSVTILGWIFIAAGSIPVAAELLSLSRVLTAGTPAIHRHTLIDTGFVLLSGLIAATAGAALLHGFRWARWVCVAWMAAHVVMSFWHSPLEVAVHAVMLVAIIYILFGRSVWRNLNRTSH